MRTISAMDLRRKTGEWLDRASAGERIVIERDHRPMAVLVPYEEAQRLEATADERRQQVTAAFDRLEALGERLRREHPEWADLPDLATVIRQDREERTDQIWRAVHGEEP
jgi:prevent-host-death family protein